MPPPYFWDGHTLILHLHVQPRASQDQLIGRHGDAIKVRITAPPVDGKANSHLIRFLAKLFKVPARHVAIIRGETSHDKCVAIQSPKTLPAGIEPPLQNR